MNLEKIFEKVSNRMISDFEEAKDALNHSGLKGTANEEIVKIFLRRYLPKTLDISSGQIADSEGGVSKQLDIIIHDAHKTPIFYQSADTRVIPIECVYAVIEVKAYLNKTELNTSLQNMKSVKSLKKKAFFTPHPQQSIIKRYDMFGKIWDYWPTTYFIFAFDSPDLTSVQTNLYQLQNSIEIHKRIDSVCIIKKGVITNKRITDNTFTLLPEPKTVSFSCGTKKSILLFYSLFTMVFNKADMEPFNIQPYLGEMVFGDDH